MKIIIILIISIVALSHFGFIEIDSNKVKETVTNTTLSLVERIQK